MKTYQNLNNILHCLKVMADEEVCEECELYNLGDVYCRDVARSAIELIKKQIPMKIKIEKYIYTKCKCGYDFSVHYGDGYYDVPHKNKTKYCPNCGQRLEW